MSTETQANRLLDAQARERALRNDAAREDWYVKTFGPVVGVLLYQELVRQEAGIQRLALKGLLPTP